MRYAVKTTRLIHETFDDEVVMVNLDTGSYYSLNETGKDLWDVIQRDGGGTLADLTACIRGRYEGDPQEIQSAAARFLDELVGEDLVVRVDTGAVAAAAEAGAAAAVAATGALPKFTAPQLSKFTDMQELLLIDIIHDVDATGWPNVAPGGSVESAG